MKSVARLSSSLLIGAFAALLAGCGGNQTPPSTSTVSGTLALSVSPSSLTMTAGAASQAITLTASESGSNSSTTPVAVVISGLPAGVSASPTQLTLTSGVTQSVTLTAGSSAAATTQLVTFSGSAGNLTNTATLAVNVTAAHSLPPPDFSLTVTPATASVIAGNSSGATLTLSAAALNGLTGNISVTTGDLGPGITATPSTLSLTPGTPQAITLTAGSAATAGTSNITVTGKCGALSHAATVSLAVAPAQAAPAPDFSLVASPASVSVTAGNSTGATLTFSAVALNGFAGAINVTPGNPGQGVTVTPSLLSLTPGTPQTMTLTAGSAAALGTSNITFTGNAGALSHSATVSLAITAVQPPPAATVTVNQAGSGSAVTNQILGMNMAYWYDQSNPAIVPAFQTAGIKAIRWPGGSGSDEYHWQTNSLCGGGYTFPAANWPTFLSDLVVPAGVDVAVTVNYGTNAACNGPGDPAEAAAWVTSAMNNGNHVSHWTVGNEVYGSWETDLHSKPNDAATYASAVASGYYPQMKAANPNTLVGVVVEPDPSWDPIVLTQAKYDFVELHFYAQNPGGESDTYLVQQAAQELTTEINSVKADLAAAGHSGTPIYTGELGSVYTDPGVQSSSITQALYAGQVLGELMNDGVSRATWWIGFGGCDEQGQGNFNFSNSLYGWQNYGGYMVFSDGLPEYGCTTTQTLAAGTLLPTARAFQLFSKVALNGEHVLSSGVSGDSNDVRAYAATHQGGTAVVLFNLNETSSESVQVNLSSQTSSPSVSVDTYDKAIYDQSQNNVWASPTTTGLGAQPLPLSLTLAPWSMNVVIIQ